MLPNFLIIGAQKAATSWLAQCLGEHPDIFMAKNKEIYFFSDLFGVKDLKWYESNFSSWAGQAIIGEATPGYISHPEAPGRIHASLGSVKFIASLRHPVDRAYSAFWHHLSRGRIPMDADFRTFFEVGDHFELRSRGNYFTQLSRYLKYYPRENLLVLVYEEVANNPEKAILDCLEFLGLDSGFVPKQLDVKINRSKGVSVMQNQFLALRRVKHLVPRRLRNPLGAVRDHVSEWSPKKLNYVRLAEELRQELLSYYMADIKQLENLLSRDLSIWYKTA